MNDVTVPAPRRGWSSQGLPVVDRDDNAFWSVFDMTVTLQLSEGQVHSLITLAGLRRAGKRSAGPKKRHVPVYRAQEALDAYEKVAALILGSAAS